MRAIAIRSRRGSVATLVLALGGLGVCGTASAAAAGPCARTPVAGSAMLTLRSGGQSRSAVVHVAPGTPARRQLPVVLALHGSGRDGAFMEGYSGLSVIADGEGFVAVYPSAAAGGWNSSAQAGRPDDVRFVADLVRALEARLCIDRQRIYATGVSSGGAMVALLGCALSSSLAAIAPVAGAFGPLPACHPDRAVSVLEIHSARDRIVPYAGRGPSHTGSVLGFLAGWRRLDGCTARATQWRLAPDALEFDWRCPNGVAVRHIRLDRAWHQYPGSYPPDPGPPPDVSAAWQTWRFFAGKRLQRARPPARR